MHACEYKGCSQNLLHGNSSSLSESGKYCSTACQEMSQHQTSSRLSSSSCDSSKKLRVSRKSLGEFQQLQQKLGQGSFGSVSLVREIKTNLKFAMKIVLFVQQQIKKADLFKYCTVENLKKEIKIQRRLNHPHIIKLDSYFEDKENVYLILEYAEQGSLFKQIKKRHKLNEDEAFVYFFQTCLGMDYLHKQKIIHRDLKPENLLLDAKGNIKICDFGWSTEQNANKKAYCGTIEYMAPEMVKNQPHNYKLDIWCLGVLLYEMIQGRPPFIGRTDSEKCSQILSDRPLKYDPGVSEDCIALITMIMQQAPAQRPSIHQIFEHRWMQKKQNNFHLNIQEYLEPVPSITTRSISYQERPQPSTLANSLERVHPIKLTQSQQMTESHVEKKPNFFTQFLISLGCIHR